MLPQLADMVVNQTYLYKLGAAYELHKSNILNSKP